MTGLRVGQGFDAHRFAPPGERLPLRLAGVEVPHDRGLLAHSDGDVALHALCDALLGAAGLGDIGQHFPDADPRWRGANSRVLLRAVGERVREAGWRTVNVDLTLVAQVPRLAPHREAMRAAVAEDLGLEAGAVSVKATTTEGLGFTGRGEGIAALAVVLLAPVP